MSDKIVDTTEIAEKTKTNKQDDNHIVFVGPKAFMKSS
jgi:hypothetical protein